MERRVTYTEVEVDALIDRAKTLAERSGRTVRAEAELLLSRDRETRLRDLRNKVVGARVLLSAIALEVDDLRAESGGDDGELTAIMATMAASCEHFTAVPAADSTSTAGPGAPRTASSAAVVPTPYEPVESAFS